MTDPPPLKKATTAGSSSRDNGTSTNGGDPPASPMKKKKSTTSRSTNTKPAAVAAKVMPRDPSGAIVRAGKTKPSENNVSVGSEPKNGSSSSSSSKTATATTKATTLTPSPQSSKTKLPSDVTRSSSSSRGSSNHNNNKKSVSPSNASGTQPPPTTAIPEEQPLVATNTTTTTSPMTTQSQQPYSLAHRADAKISSDRQHGSFLRKRRELKENSNHVAVRVGDGSIEVEEAEARKQAARNNSFLWLTITNWFAAFKVFVVYLVSIDTIICNLLTIGMTIYWWETKENQPAWHGAMNFVLVTFAVASPITVAIRMSFNRREQALMCIANVRSFALHIYMAHALWDWKGTEGRAKTTEFDFEQHCDEVLDHLIGIGDEMTRFLTLPTFSKPRHRVLKSGRKEASQSLRVAYHLLDSVLVQHVMRLSVLAERLKAIGLSGSEISRVRQYERHFSNQLEQLRMYKVYRTPQALWAFACIFTLLLPPFYAPTFTEVARELGHLWLGIAFAMITATCLTALFESVQILEDPFTAFITLDGIDVSEEMEVLQWTQLINARRLLFPQSKPYPMRTRPAITGKGYDPTVHYHSTPSMREALLKQAGAGVGGAYDNMANTDDIFDDNDNDDIEEGQHHRRSSLSSARKRISHFAV